MQDPVNGMNVSVDTICLEGTSEVISKVVYDGVSEIMGTVDSNLGN